MFHTEDAHDFGSRTSERGPLRGFHIQEGIVNVHTWQHSGCPFCEKRLRDVVL